MTKSNYAHAETGIQHSSLSLEKSRKRQIIVLGDVKKKKAQRASIEIFVIISISISHVDIVQKDASERRRVSLSIFELRTHITDRNKTPSRRYQNSLISHNITKSHFCVTAYMCSMMEELIALWKPWLPWPYSCSALLEDGTGLLEELGFALASAS